MSNVKKPRLFSGKWFAQLPKKEALALREQRAKLMRALESAQQRVNRFGELNAHALRFDALTRAIITNRRDEVQRHILWGKLLELNSSLPPSLKLENSTLNDLRRRDGLVRVSELVAENIREHMDHLSSNFDSHNRLEKANSAVVVFDAALRAREKELRLRSRKGLRRVLRVGSLLLLRKTKNKSLIPRYRPRAH